MPNANQVTGMILGMTAGDCVGGPYLFLKSKTLFNMAPRAFWRIADPGAVTQFVLAGMHAVKHHGLNADDRRQAYIKRLSRSDADLDFVSAQAFSDCCPGKNNVRAVGMLCSNMLLVRQIAIVLGTLKMDMPAFIRHSLEESRLTHDSPLAVMTALLGGTCLRCILLGHERKMIWETLESLAVKANMQQFLHASFHEKPICDGSNYSENHIALQMALYHFWHDTPFVSAIRSTILAGGATDLNAAFTGALLGAAYGLANIPADWQSAVLNDLQQSEAILHGLYNALELTGQHEYVQGLRFEQERLKTRMYTNAPYRKIFIRAA